MSRANYRVLTIPILFILLYHQVFIANYAYLDEIYQLWHNQDSTNYDMFFDQGRWLTGVLFQKFFGSISTIEQIKYLRIFSWSGWIVTAICWSSLFRSWLKWLKYDHRLALLSDLFVLCSLSVCVYVGWASCFEVFLAAGLGLLSGHLFFTQMMRVTDGGKMRLISILLSLVSGVASLFIYQTGFGMFLLPFLFYYMRNRKAEPTRAVERGILFYLSVYAIYYFLFKYSLEWSGVIASNRTAIQFNIVKKFAFFFSGPLPAAFCLNILYRGSSIPCQVIYGLVFLTWLISVFKRSEDKALISKLLFIAIVMLLLALIYLPSMIATENFASYRTLFAFNLAVFVMVMESFFSWLKTERWKNIFTIVAAIFLLSTAFYAYNIQLVQPLKKEYKAIQDYFDKNYHPYTTETHFIRADVKLFRKKFNLRDYKDEFGAPSASRDWVAEGLIKQLVVEKTNNRDLANKMIVKQYPGIDSFQRVKPTIDSSKLIINVNEIVE